MNRNCAIVLAAGKGVRMGASVNKQYIKLKEKPVLYYTLKAFSQCELIHDIIIVAAKEEIEYCKKEVVDKYGIDKVSKIVQGGEERQGSVINGLEEVENCDIVLIHDGARPFVDKSIIENGIKYAKIYGACACGVAPKDTIKVRCKNGLCRETLKREELFCVQTPQTFKYELILDCHRKLKRENVRVTDDTMVAERYGHKVYLYEGSYNNIKITTPEDLIISKGFLDRLLT